MNLQKNTLPCGLASITDYGVSRLLMAHYARLERLIGGLEYYETALQSWQARDTPKAVSHALNILQLDDFT